MLETEGRWKVKGVEGKEGEGRQGKDREEVKKNLKERGNGRKLKENGG